MIPILHDGRTIAHTPATPYLRAGDILADVYDWPIRIDGSVFGLLKSEGRPDRLQFVAYVGTPIQVDLGA